MKKKVNRRLYDFRKVEADMKVDPLMGMGKATNLTPEKIRLDEFDGNGYSVGNVITTYKSRRKRGKE